MKTTKILILLVLTLILSCSSDSIPTTPNTEPNNLSEFVYSVYNPSTLEVTEFTTYTIENNKIVNSTYYSNEYNTTLQSTYTYSNGKISEITSYENNQMFSKLNYFYNSNDRLSEYIIQADTLQFSTYEKHTFTYAQDTIYIERKRSTDGINYDTSVSDMKTILNENSNRIYFETNDHLHNLPKSITRNTYDSNNNMILEETSYYIDDFAPYETNIMYDYNTNINTLQFIYNETFTRENVMLLYHLESPNFFNFNPRFLSPNSINNFSTTSFNAETYPVVIENILNNNEYSIFDDYQIYASNNIDYFYRFTLEYIFE